MTCNCKCQGGRADGGTHIGQRPQAKRLAVWGYGLTWAKDVLRAIRECGCPDLDVLIVCPSERAIRELFDDEVKESNLLKRPANLQEWRALTPACVKSVHVVETYAIPNHHGLLVDHDFLLLATYGVRPGQQRPEMYRQDRALRKVLIYTAGGEEDDLMIEQWYRHLLARASDGQEVTA